jgi:hypothetical protein
LIAKRGQGFSDPCFSWGILKMRFLQIRGEKKNWIFSEKSKEADRIGTGCLKLPPIKEGAPESESLSLPPRFSCKQNKFFQNLRPPSHFDSLCVRAYI